MSATCIITNCRKRAPAGEPFCSEHREKADPRKIIRALVEASEPLRKWAEVPLKREQTERSVIYAETPSPVEDACTAFDAAVATARVYLGDRP